MNRGQDLVIGGYIPRPHGFDSLIVGYYRGSDLVYVARVRNGFVPASRRQVFEKIRLLASPTMPFVNLPAGGQGREKCCQGTRIKAPFVNDGALFVLQS